MKPLLWKEWTENLKWAVLPTLLILGPMAPWGAPSLLSNGSLFYVSLVAALFGTVLGFLQVFFEAQGDKRALLLHRPLNRSRIFLAKVLAGVGLYLLAVGLPSGCVVALAAAPGHIPEPFAWPMALPWLADSLTGLVYYFAGLLAAQREARWYGSRCLGLAAGLGCTYLVWTLPEFGHALVAIVLVGGVVAVAAWGSFLAGGAYGPQPRLAKCALAATFLMGLSALSVSSKYLVGMWFEQPSYYSEQLDRRGQVLVAHVVGAKLRSVTDLEGQVPRELQGQPLDDYALKQIQAPSAGGARAPQTRSYRSPVRFLVEFNNESKPGDEAWWFAPEEGRLQGYDKDSNQFVGSFGPDGYCPPDEQPRERFQGELLSGMSMSYAAWANHYLAFVGGVYAVDFRHRTVQTLFVPAAGETVLQANRWKDDKQELVLVVVTTDQAVHVLDKAGSRVFSAPWALDPKSYRLSAGRLEDPMRYWVWYRPQWHLGLVAVESRSDHVVEYDPAGREIARRTLVPRQAPGLPFTDTVEPSYHQALFGLVTPPAEAAVLVGSMHNLLGEFRANRGTEMWLLLQFLVSETSYFLPGAGLNMPADAGILLGFAALMLLSAVACALACFLVARRYAFARSRLLGWALCGLLFGPTGLLLMLALLEWPARVACPSCRRPRLVDRERCEHCGAAHALPTPDGTEVFETTAEAGGATRSPVYQTATLEGEDRT